MKIYLFLIVLSTCAIGESAAQGKDQRGQSGAHQHLASFGFYIPVGSFSKSHGVGVGIDYSRSRYRFGENVKTGKFGSWVLNGGLHYYPGKKVPFNGYDFRYGGYLNIYAAGGVIINPILRANMMLTAGPSLDIYKKSVNGGGRVSVSTHYFVSTRVAIGASFTYLKHARSESLLSAGVKASYAF